MSPQHFIRNVLPDLLDWGQHQGFPCVKEVLTYEEWERIRDKPITYGNRNNFMPLTVGFQSGCLIVKCHALPCHRFPYPLHGICFVKSNETLIFIISNDNGSNGTGFRQMPFPHGKICSIPFKHRLGSFPILIGTSFQQGSRWPDWGNLCLI